MASLRFSFGTMGSGKSTVALQIHHNLSSRELYGLLLTTLDREGREPTDLLDERLRSAALETTRRRTLPNVGDHVAVRFSSLGDDGVLLGAAALVLRNELGIA